MEHNPLLDMVSELGRKIRSLERERNEAVARAQALEREVTEMSGLISVARARLAEMLKAGAGVDIAPAAEVTVETEDLERLDEFSPDPQRRPRGRFPGAAG